MIKVKLVNISIAFILLLFIILTSMATSETLYVDSRNGDDANPGTKDQPIKTFEHVAELINSSNAGGPTNLIVAPGVYNLIKTVLIQNKRPYTRKDRLIIKARILPYDSDWKPELMPIIISTGFPERPVKTDNIIEYTGLKIEISHVTIQGIKFLGSPVPRIWYYPIFREGKDLDDLVVTQCLFTMESYAVTCNVGVLANGHGLVVDHCIFYNCRNPVVFWRAEGGVSHRNAMQYCIVDGGYTSGIWLCDTGEDFEFHHNIFTRCKYAWMRSSDNKSKYRIHDCIITDFEIYDGVCSANFEISAGGSEISNDEKNVVKKGSIKLVTGEGIDVEIPHNFLHIVPGTLGSELGAGLFLVSSPKDSIKFTMETYPYKKINGHEILADIYRPKTPEAYPAIIYLHGGGMILGNRHDFSEALRDKLIEANYAFISIDFRLAPETKLEKIIEDVCDAYRWIQDKGIDLFNIAHNKIAIMGGSSGGYLALITGFSVKSKPQAIVSVSGLGDLSLLIERESAGKISSVTDNVPPKYYSNKPVTDGSGEDRLKLTQNLREHGQMLFETLGFDPLKETKRYEKLSLFKNISSSYPPTMIIHSQDDRAVPFTESEKIINAFKDKGVIHEFFLLKDGHSSEIFENHPEVIKRLISFLDKYLK